MIRRLTAVLALVLAVTPAGAAGIKGSYIEARTCDVWTGPCFANAEVNLTGKHAILGWKIDEGNLDGVKLDGLSVVAIVAASDTLGLTQTGPRLMTLMVAANLLRHEVPIPPLLAPRALEQQRR